MQDRSQVSEGGQNGVWVYSSDIRVDQGVDFLGAKYLYPYHNALSDTAAEIPDDDDSVIFVGIRFTINTNAAVRYPGGLKITVTSNLSEQSCYLWRYDAEPTQGIADLEIATRAALGGYNSTNIAADLDTVLGGAVTEADGTAQSVDCDLTDEGEHDIYIYLRSENVDDAGKTFTVTLSLDETEPGEAEMPEHPASMGLNFSYNAGLGGYEVSQGTADPNQFENGTIYVPSMYDGDAGELPVVAVAAYGFEYSTMTGIVLPKTVTKINYMAFAFSSLLTTVTVASGSQLKMVSDNAFDGTPWFDCQADGVVYIGGVLYRYKGSMSANTNIAVRDGTLVIRGDAFNGCTSLASITIPASVTDIDERAFYHCNQLTSITFEDEDSITHIGYNAFVGTPWYDSLSTGADGVVYIGKILYSCKGTVATSITVQTGTVYIMEYAFNNCASLVSITIPASVTDIGSYAFDSCTSLGSVTFDSNSTLARIGSGAFAGSRLTGIEIPASVEFIGSWAFERSDALTEIKVIGNATKTAEWGYKWDSNKNVVYTEQ